MNIIDDIEYIEAKTLLTKNKHKERWFGADYNLNIYRGCSHGCIYCDSRSDCYRIENFDKVTVKKNSLHILEKEIKSKRLKGVISTGAMSDPYNPLEARLNLTRESLELIYKYGWGVDLTTKSDLIARDYDIFGKISIFSPICIKMTVTAADDETARKIIDFICQPEHKWTVVVTSTNQYWKEKASRTIIMEKGRIINDIKINHA